MTQEERELEEQLAGDSTGNIDYEPDEPIETEAGETGPEDGWEETTGEGVEEEEVAEEAGRDSTGDGDGGTITPADAPDRDGGDPATSGGALMSPDEIARMNRLKDWSVELSKRLGGGMTVNMNGVFEVPGAANGDDLKRALLMMNDADLNGSNMGVVLKLGIAEMIIQIASREDKDFAVVIDEQGVIEGYGRNIDTIYQWIRVVQEVPRQCFKFGLTMSHYIAAASVRKPTDPKEAKAFYDKKVAILKRAAKDPKAIGSRQVGREVKEAAGAASAKSATPKREGVGAILRRLNDCHRAKDASEIDGTVLDSLGVTRASLVNQIEADEGELILRDEIAEDVSKLVFHWTPVEGDDPADETTPPDAIDIEGEEISE